MAFFEFFDKVAAIKQQLGQVIKGKERAIELLLTAVLSDGNVLMDDVPGVGKTTMAKALARCVRADFKRIQFTPDLLPADILGASIYNQKNSDFIFYKGPIFSNIILADEINRASPRTQSALLEAMNEKQVTIEGALHALPTPFMVIATENPIEYYGTYPLPEAQLDRFAMRFQLGYPDENAELEMMDLRRTGDPIDSIQPCLDAAELASVQKELRNVQIEKSVQRYILAVIRATRVPDSGFRLGASPRSFLTLCRCAQAFAWLQKREYVIPDDVRLLAEPVLAHRLVTDVHQRHSGVTPSELLAEVMKKIVVPT